MKKISYIIISCSLISWSQVSCGQIQGQDQEQTQESGQIIEEKEKASEMPEFPIEYKDEFYFQLKKEVLAIYPNEKDLKKAKTTAIPENFMDTLIANDWYEIAEYDFSSSNYYSKFDEIEQRETKLSSAYQFMHYSEDGTLYTLALDRNNRDKEVFFRQISSDYYKDFNPTCQFAIKKGSFLCFLCVL